MNLKIETQNPKPSTKRLLGQAGLGGSQRRSREVAFGREERLQKIAHDPVFCDEIKIARRRSVEISHE